MDGGFAFAPTAAPLHPNDRWAPLVCRAVWDETPTARSFLLAPPDGARVVFEPGQFVTLRAEIDGETVERCYTISSSAAVERAIVVTVKRVAGGRLSPWLHAHLRPGARIEAFGPAGVFGPGEPAPARLALVSAGVGATPMAATLAWAADLGLDLDAVWVHAARDRSEALFADALALWRRRLPRLGAHLALSAAGGRLTAAGLLAAVPDIAGRTVLCCGPEGFMAMVRAACAEAGVAPAAYREESFDFGGAAPVAPAPVEAPTRRVVFAKSGRAFDVAAGQTILQAAKAAGVPMAASCAKGVCGTCKTRKLSGAVQMAHGGGVRQREIDAGMILPCCARPETDVTLDR